MHNSRSPSLLSCLLLAICLAPAVAAEEPPASFQMIHSGPGLSRHKEMFLLPATWSDAYEGAQTEAVFQLSTKHRLFASRFYFSYTQISFWQAYDLKSSSPFRETNYNPEFFYRFEPIAQLSGHIGADVGIEHESNGQRMPDSRSWNLLYVCPYYLRPSFLLYFKIRYRIPEDAKDTPDSAIGDDNPDIMDFYGHGDFHFYWRLWKDHLMHLLVRGNPETGKGWVSMNYSFPLPRGEGSFLMLRLSRGYGESLLDYSRSISRIGLGIMLVR